MYNNDINNKKVLLRISIIYQTRVLFIVFNSRNIIIIIIHIENFWGALPAKLYTA